MKIQIIGYSGSGKSTLAKKLGEFYNIPYLHLDNTKFYGDWLERSKEDQETIVKDFLMLKDSWVIDGNYTKVYPERFSQSDLTIFLNYNRFYCYNMAKKRFNEYKGKIRESCPCKEKFDLEFKKWLLIDGRTASRKKNHLNNLNKTQGNKLIFRNINELNSWLKKIGLKK